MSVVDDDGGTTGIVWGSSGEGDGEEGEINVAIAAVLSCASYYSVRGQGLLHTIIRGGLGGVGQVL